jgi:hypothetical protein
MMKTRRMRWVGHVALIGHMINAHTFWLENPRRFSVYTKLILLKWVLRKYGGWRGLD